MFSIVIPLYNKQKSIVNTISSVLDQEYSNFELLVVDDGSIDKSLEAVKSFEDNRIKIFSKENGGVCSARNYGIAKASYDWIAFLDADDLWRKNHLAILAKLIYEYKDYKVFTTSYKLSTQEIVEISDETNIIHNYFKAILKDDKITCSSCCVIHKECFSKVGYFNENLSRGEDLEMWARIGRKYSIVKNQNITAIYNLAGENRNMASSIPFEKSYASVINFENVNNSFEKRYFTKQIKRKFKSCLYRKEWKCLVKLFIKFNFRLLLSS